MFNGNLETSPYATDIMAWHVTRGLHHVDPSASYPTEDMVWGLAGLENCFTFVHVDAEGASTKNLVGCGKKAWGVIDDSGSVKLSSIDFFLDVGFRLGEVLPSSKYDMELIVLEQGDML